MPKRTDIKSIMIIGVDLIVTGRTGELGRIGRTTEAHNNESYRSLSKMT